ncbi:acetylxylan esterase [Subtercola endophyticus]|uniref:acetylxylan esterase n=1 Tax=Subtercola endophyticus TaxID=2895559 RepID=UPI001E2D783D|nr:acetylxylan esterase [Subtercola endophyticus]UFS60833.1 acetylxylan esterase [Subtercola endophyticus]
MHFDLPEADLADYRSTQHNPDDFDAFWADTLATSRQYDVSVRFAQVESPVRQVDVYDVTFRGFENQEVRAWLRTPHGALHGLPTLVEFVGYGGGRGHAEDSLFWASCGFAHLTMDSRGQGAAGRAGDTGDDAWTGPHVPGMMTVGIQDSHTYYYRRLITDAVRAIDTAEQLVHPSTLVSYGISQGGGVALAAAALNEKVTALVANVPFLCDFPRAITITDSDPYAEIRRFLAVHPNLEQQVHETLSYFDGVNFARRATAPALFSTALMDTVCPPSTVFGAFNAYSGAKQIHVRRFNGHDHACDDDVRIARWLMESFPNSEQ